MALAHVCVNAVLISPVVAQVTVRSPGVWLWRDSNVVVITLIALEISLRQTASSVERSGNIYFMSSLRHLSEVLDYLLLDLPSYARGLW